MISSLRDCLIGVNVVAANSNPSLGNSRPWCLSYEEHAGIRVSNPAICQEASWGLGWDSPGILHPSAPGWEPRLATDAA
jgi:hypothetical protein